MNVYAVLGVEPDAGLDEIKAAYHERARVLHPDRHVRADGTVPIAVQEAFVELNQAFKGAVRARAIPRQGTPRSRPAHLPGPAAGAVPRQRRRTTPVREDDPMLALLTLPQRCRRPWSTEALEVWALTVVPAARHHLREAQRIADAAGPVSERHRVAATAHVLMTLTLTGRTSRRFRVLADRLEPAYTALEGTLPPALVERLPPRVTRVGRRRLLGH